MSPLLQRLIGLLLTIASVLGLFINIGAIALIPGTERQIVAAVDETLATLDGTLGTTAEGLDLARGSLDDVEVILRRTEQTTRNVAVALDESAPLLENLATVAGVELPVAVIATAQGLDAAEDGANTVEVILTTLSAIPILDIPRYNPEVTLGESLSRVSTSLDALPSSFVDIGSDITAVGTNLERVQRDVDVLGESIGELNTSLEEARAVSDQYAQVVADQQALVSSLRQGAPVWTAWGIRAVLFVLIWLAIAQVGLLSQGLEMIGRSRRQQP